MKNKDLILDLAKLVISASWEDGEMVTEEINAMKDLLFSLDDVHADDWTILTMYMESPPSEDEKEELLKRVTGAIKSKKHKDFALDTLEKLFHCDGDLSPEEELLLDKFKTDISNASTGLSNRPFIAAAIMSALHRCVNLNPMIIS